jgi:hypothetical protein
VSSSGVTSYSVTELEIIKAIMGKIGVGETGQTPDADDIDTIRRNLNMIYKQWVAQADFAPGLKMWTRRRAYLFLTPDQVEYSIGPSGDECAAEEYVPMELAAISAAGGATVTVTDASDAVVAMRIGVLTSTGALHWTTIASKASNVITLTDVLPANVAAGDAVFAYTSKPVKPFEITSAALRDTDEQDSPMDPNLSIDEYEQIPGKKTDGTPSRLYFEAKKDSCRVYLNCAPDDVSKVVRLVYHSYVEDTSVQTQDVDFPAEWFRPLVMQGAIDSAPDFGAPMKPEWKLLRDESLSMARNAHPLKSVAFYQSEPDEY